MSGASSSARSSGTASEATSWSWWAPSTAWPGVPRTRAKEPSTRSSSNHRAAVGWWISTGERVVGRSTPGTVTSAPTTLFTSVDLPAPVEPPTTASTGASMSRSRGMT